MNPIKPAITAPINRYKAKHPAATTYMVLEIAVNKLLRLKEDSKEAVRECYRNNSITSINAAELLSRIGYHCDDIEVLLSEVDRERAQ